MKYKILLICGASIALSACAGGQDMVVGGPVPPPAKPYYEPYVPVQKVDDDFITAAGTNTVFFETNSADIDGEARATLDRQAAWLMAHPYLDVRIEGNADERASNSYNYDLGLRRAQSVVDYLVAKGLTRSRFSVVSFGETKPVVAKPGNIPVNRRAVTVVMGDGGVPVDDVDN